MIHIPEWRHVRRRGSILCAITQHGWKEISSMKRTTKKTLFVFVLIAAMMLSIFPAAAFAEGAAAVEPAAQTEQQPEKDAAPAAKDDGAKPAEPAKGDGAKPAEPVKDGENKAEPVKNDEKSVVVEGKDGEKPADPELKDGDEKGEPEVKNDGEEPVKEEENTGAAPKTPEEENGDEKAEEEKDVPAVSDAVRAFLAAASAFTMPEDVMALTDEECQTLAAQINDLFVMYSQLSEEDRALPEVQTVAAALEAAYGALDARNTAEVLAEYNSIPLNLTVTCYGAPFISGSTGQHTVKEYYHTEHITRDAAGSRNPSGSATGRFIGSNETGWTLVIDIAVGNYKTTVTTNARITNKDMSAATGTITFGMSFGTAGGVGTTIRIRGAKDLPKPSPTPSPTPTPTPTPTPIPSSTPTPIPSSTPTPTPSTSPSPAPVVKATLNYDGNGAGVTNVPPSESQNVAPNTFAEFTVSGIQPNRNGYTFKGWNTKADGSGASYSAGATVKVFADTSETLYAVWVKNVKLEIIYNGNADGVQNIPGPDVKWVEPNGNFVFTIANGPTRPGYRFVEWNTADNGTGDSIKPGQTTLLYARETGYSKTYYAKWEKATDEAALDFEPNANGDTSVGNMPSKMTDTVDKGTNAQFTVPTAPPTREGYVFKHWNTAANDSGDKSNPGDQIEVPAGTTTTLYAQWATGMNTTLMYDANHGTGAPDAVSKDVAEGTDGEFIVSSVEPTRYGYKFVGWTENSDGSGQKYKNPDTIKIPAGQTKTLFAQWELELTQMEVPVKLQVIFNGIDSLPTDFAYSVTGADGNVALKGTLTKAGEALVGTSHAYYYVTDAPVTLDVDKDYTFNFTQSGYQIDGYTWSGNVTETLTGKVLPENKENGLILTIVNNYTKEEVTPVDWGKLGISKSVSPAGPVKPGTTLTYTITVTNNTGADLDSVVVYDKLDRHLTFVSATGTGSYSTLTGFWNVGALANGASAALVIKATVNAGTADKTVIYNTASVLAASSGNEALKVGSGPSASANVAVTNPGSGTWGGTTWGKGVQTGDDANLGLWIAAMIVSFLCVAALVYVNRKRIFKGKANNK